MVRGHLDATEAFAPPKGAPPSHGGTNGAAAAQGCHAAPRHATGGTLQYAPPLQLVAPFGGSCGRAPL